MKILRSKIELIQKKYPIPNSQVQINETRALEIASNIHDIFENKSMEILKNKKNDSSLYDSELYLSRN